MAPLPSASQRPSHSLPLLRSPAKMGKGKPSGIRAGRKLKVHRRNERWSSKKYNKSHSVSHMKANPLGGSCMSKGIVLEKMYVNEYM